MINMHLCKQEILKWPLVTLLGLQMLFWVWTGPIDLLACSHSLDWFALWAHANDWGLVVSLLTLKNYIMEVAKTAGNGGEPPEAKNRSQAGGQQKAGTWSCNGKRKWVLPIAVTWKRTPELPVQSWLPAAPCDSSLVRAWVEDGVNSTWTPDQWKPWQISLCAI